MKPFFKPEDFGGVASTHSLELIADKANSLLEKALGPVVYLGSDFLTVWYEQPLNNKNTNQAYLFNIQPIKQECMKHEPEKTRLEFGGVPIAKCKHCGVEIVATWEA